MIDCLPPEIIELGSIRLRRPRVTDASAIFDYGSDPMVAKYADWPIRTSMETLIESNSEREEPWDAGIEYSWVIAAVKDDHAIGGVFCKIAEDAAEIGFLLNKRYWRRRYAAAAARAITEWLYSVPVVSRVWATCDTEHIASIRVLEKTGFTQEKTLYRAIARPQISVEPRDAFCLLSTTIAAHKKRIHYLLPKWC